MSSPRLLTVFAVLAMATALVVSLSACQAAEAKFPTRQIAFQVGNTPGSVIDLYSRQAAALAEKVLKVALPVENRPGGSSVVALAYVKSQPADGYTIMSSSNTAAYVFARPDATVAITDFEWIIRQTADPTALFVRADGPIKTIEEFVQLAKSSPTGIKVGGAGSGQTPDQSQQRFAELAGIKTPWVAFDGTPQAIAAVLGGHVDGVEMATAGGLAMVRDGKLRMLAVTDSKRFPALPDVPTFKEKGWDVQGIIARGIIAKKGTPPAVVKTLHDAFKQITTTPEWQDYVKKQETADAYLGTEDFNKQMAKETEDARTYLKQIGAIK